MKIFKYTLPLPVIPHILPEGVEATEFGWAWRGRIPFRAVVGLKPQSVAVQRGEIVVWAELADNALEVTGPGYVCGRDKGESAIIYGVETGKQFHLPYAARFLGTVMLHGGEYVLHIYSGQ